MFLLVASVLAIGGSALSVVLDAAGLGGLVLGVWVVVFDLGLKLALAAVLWSLFQRRPRADRLNLADGVAGRIPARHRPVSPTLAAPVQQRA